MVCEYTSAIGFSKHNAKAFADAYSEEERSALSQHLKELKASKQYKSVRLFFPGENTELYYEVTNSEGKKGLLYSTISSQNEIKDTLLVPMQYYGFAVMPRTTGKEPYIAYNAQRTFTRPIYFDHGHEETVILASLTPKVNQWDIYSASHLSNYKSAMTCFRMLSNIQDSSLSYVMGLVVLNAKVYCSNNSEKDYIFIHSEDTSACLYTAAGQPIFTKDQKISTIVLYFKNSYQPCKTRVQYISKGMKCGTAYLNQKEAWMPCIFADASFNEYDELLIKCNQKSDFEVYDSHKDYSLLVKESNSPIAAYYNGEDYENGIKFFCEMPESQQTLDDIIYAARCCELAITYDVSLIQNINGLLEHSADLQTVDLPNIEKMQQIIQLGKLLYTKAKNQDMSLTSICDKGISNFTKAEEMLPAVLQEYEAHDITRSAIYERQRQQAAFWGAVLQGFVDGIGDAAYSSSSNSSTYAPNVAGGVSTTSSYSSSSTSSSSSSSGGSGGSGDAVAKAKAKTRISELKNQIHTYEGLLRDAEAFETKCRAEKSNFLGQAIKDVNNYKKKLKDLNDEMNNLKSKYGL